MKPKMIVVVIFLVFTTSWTRADEYCFAEAEAHYNIDRRILYALSIVESQGNNAAKNTNSNKSIDRGHMQLNSWWGFTKEEIADPCFQTLAGAAILSDCFKHYGTGPDAFSCYNTGKPLSALPLKRREAAKRHITKIYDKFLE